MRIRLIDAFTDRPFTGNPAGVCLLDGPDWPDEQWMQAVAMEMNQAETAFAHPTPDGAWALRWFTPLVEVDLCGHATLATAHGMAEDGLVDKEIRFTSRSGILTATFDDHGAITLDFPAAPLTAIDPPAGLAEALEAVPVAAYDTGPLGDLLVEVADEDTVRRIRPHLDAIARLQTRGVIVTAPAADPAAGYDFVSRFFGPAVGVPEDPVTGSAHTALAPLWSQRLARPTLTGLQASHRPGKVKTTHHPHQGRVHLTGQATTVLTAHLSPTTHPAHSP